MKKLLLFVLCTVLLGCDLTVRYHKGVCSGGYTTGWQRRVDIYDGTVKHWLDDSIITYKMKGGESCTELTKEEKL